MQRPRTLWRHTAMRENRRCAHSVDALNFLNFHVPTVRPNAVATTSDEPLAALYSLHFVPSWNGRHSARLSSRERQPSSPAALLSTFSTSSRFDT